MRKPSNTHLARTLGASFKTRGDKLVLVFLETGVTAKWMSNQLTLETHDFGTSGNGIYVSPLARSNLR